MNQVHDGQVQISGNQFIGASNGGTAFDKWASEAQLSKFSLSDANDTSKEKSFAQWGVLPPSNVTDENRNTLGNCSFFASIIRFTPNIFPVV